ncbi:hypothetical protein L0128_16975 [candidate division KSB1 bacterium]|nr:hypothetical protein [candidate division KSB1 bacterium]
MRMKFLWVFILFLVAIFDWGCQNSSPVMPANEGLTQLHLEFVGAPITLPGLTKPTMAEVSGYQKIVIAVYSEGEVTDDLQLRQPLASTEIQLAPNDTAFSGQLLAPVGSKRLFVVQLFEFQSKAASNALDSTLILSYCGRKSGVLIELGKINQVSMQLYPVPIKRQRVVLWGLPSVAKLGATSFEFPVGIATLDSLRGIQFDMQFAREGMETEALSISPLGENFSDYDFNNLNERRTRIVLFDRTSNRGFMLPVADLCAVPMPLLQAKINLAEVPLKANDRLQIDLQNGRVTVAHNFNLAVYAVPGSLFIE